MDTQTLEIIIKALFAFLSTIVIYVLVPFIKQKVGEAKYNELCDFCVRAEAAAAQLFKDNDQKREYVEMAIIKHAKEIGLNIDSSTVQVTLEGLYKIYKETINNGEQTI